MNNQKSLLLFVIVIWILVFLFGAVRLSMDSNATSLDKKTVFQHNGQEFQTGSFIHGGRIFVPLRMLSEKLGYIVKWNPTYKTISISNFYYSAQFQLNSKNVILQDNKTITMDVEPLVIDGSTFIPVRYAVESLGKFIELYNDETIRIINITDYNPTQELNR